MKTTTNQSPKASQLLVERATACGIDASIIERSKPESRRYSANGSTHAPQKVVLLNGIRFSIGGARQYIEARETTND